MSDLAKSPLAKLTILVVDDNNHMRQIVSTILRSLGCKLVLEAGDGAQALDVLRQRPVDAAIADYNMSPIDGVEFLRLLRTARDSPKPRLPVVLMTAYSDKKTVLAAHEAGASAIVAKPISALTLGTRLLHALEHPIPGEGDAYFL